MSSFQDLGVFVHINPEAEAQRSYAHAAFNNKTERELRVTPLGLCVIVNENPLNLEQTTSNVLSVSVLLLIYALYII